LSEALIFASTNPQYDDRLFLVHENCKLRIPAEHVVYTNCCFCFDIQNNFGTQHVLQMLRASEKDLPVLFELVFRLREVEVSLISLYNVFNIVGIVLVIYITNSFSNCHEPLRMKAFSLLLFDSFHLFNKFLNIHSKITFPLNTILRIVYK
jgi:hypothetical protein